MAVVNTCLISGTIKHISPGTHYHEGIFEFVETYKDKEEVVPMLFRIDNRCSNVLAKIDEGLKAVFECSIRYTLKRPKQLYLDIKHIMEVK